MLKQKQTKQEFGKMRTREMIGYGFTDMAGNLLFVTFSSFIMIFYTDVMGLPASGGWSAAIVLLVARIVNAILSVVWGSIIDHTKTKWGQCRPWFLFLAGPFCVTTFLCFCNFGGSTIAKFWYAMLLYILSSGFVYTGLSAAMSAVLPNLTSKNEERIKANSWRMVGGALGSFITTVCTPLITGALISGAFAKFGDAKAKNYAYMVVIAMWAIMAAAMLVSAFAWMKERNYNPNYKPLAFKTSCKALKGNWPWFILVSAFIMMWVVQSTKSGTAVYYAKWILCNDTWVPSVINGLQVIGVITAIITPFVVKAFSKKFKAPKSSVLFMALGITIIGQIGMALFDPTFSKFITPHSVGHISSFLAWWIVGTFGLQWTMGMFFMMIADTVDYGEWKTGIKAPGLLASVGASFSIQLGGAFGQYVPMQIMGAKGYNGTITMDPTKIYGGQTESAAWAIKFSFFWLPLIFMVVLGAIMIAYIRFEKNEGKIRAILEERHSKVVQTKPAYIPREVIKQEPKVEKKQEVKVEKKQIKDKKAKKADDKLPPRPVSMHKAGIAILVALPIFIGLLCFVLAFALSY